MKKNFLFNINMIALVTLVSSLAGCFKNSLTENTTSPNKQTISEIAISPTKNLPSATLSENNGQVGAKNCHNDRIFEQYQQHNPDKKTQVLGCGQIIKLLPDDNDGTRHQKFLVKLDGYPQITVLIAHNIDLATRINTIKTRTPIRFYGEYIYNDKGGVVHWTHKDPAARHQAGWLDYQNKRYW